MTDKPFLVGQSEALRAAFQRGNDDEMLRIIAPGNPDGLLGRLIKDLQGASERTLTFAAPYLSDLANRVGYLTQTESVRKTLPSPTYRVGGDEMA